MDNENVDVISVAGGVRFFNAYQGHCTPAEHQVVATATTLSLGLRPSRWRAS